MRSALAQRFAPALTREQRQAGVRRVQRGEPADGRAHRRRDRADRLALCRCRHHRRPPPKTGDAGPRLYASGAHAPRFATLKQFGLDVRVLSGPADRGLGAEDVLCRHDQGHAGAQRRHAARGDARRHRRRADRASCKASQPQLLAWLKELSGGDAAEGLSLGRRDARDRRFRRRGPGRATSSMSAPRTSTSRSRAISTADKKDVAALEAFFKKAAK